MALVWGGHVKIHEGCGGVCRWVEAVDTPGVGFQGECTRCRQSELQVEEMLPMPKELSVVEARSTDLEEVRWKDDDSFSENMNRLYEEVLLP